MRDQWERRDVARYPATEEPLGCRWAGNEKTGRKRRTRMSPSAFRITVNTCAPPFLNSVYTGCAPSSTSQSACISRAEDHRTDEGRTSWPNRVRGTEYVGSLAAGAPVGAGGACSSTGDAAGAVDDDERVAAKKSGSATGAVRVRRVGAAGLSVRRDCILQALVLGEASAESRQLRFVARRGGLALDRSPLPGWTDPQILIVLRAGSDCMRLCPRSSPRFSSPICPSLPGRFIALSHLSRGSRAIES